MREKEQISRRTFVRRSFFRFERDHDPRVWVDFSKTNSARTGCLCPARDTPKFECRLVRGVPALGAASDREWMPAIVLENVKTERHLPMSREQERRIGKLVRASGRAGTRGRAACSSLHRTRATIASNQPASRAMARRDSFRSPKYDPQRGRDAAQNPEWGSCESRCVGLV